MTSNIQLQQCLHLPLSYNLQMRTSRSLSWNQLLKLNQPSNSHKYVNTTQIKQNYHQKKRKFNSLDEEHWIRFKLGICKSRSMSRNQLQKLNLHSNAHNYVYITRNQTKLPQKGEIFKSFPTIHNSKQFDIYWF